MHTKTFETHRMVVKNSALSNSPPWYEWYEEYEWYEHGPDNGTKPGGERHRREAPSQAKFGYGEREALPQVRCAGKFQARSARNAEREALPQAKFGRGERAALPHVCCAEEFH